MSAMPIFAGEDKEAIAAHKARQRYEEAALLAGRAMRTIYLNGGSDTRRGAFEHYRELYEPLGVKVEYCGWCVVIGARATVKP
jgi:hypothetical protein